MRHRIGDATVLTPNLIEPRLCPQLNLLSRHVTLQSVTPTLANSPKVLGQLISMNGEHDCWPFPITMTAPNGISTSNLVKSCFRGPQGEHNIPDQEMMRDGQCERCQEFYRDYVCCESHHRTQSNISSPPVVMSLAMAAIKPPMSFHFDADTSAARSTIEPLPPCGGSWILSFNSFGGRGSAQVYGPAGVNGSSGI